MLAASFLAITIFGCGPSQEIGVPEAEATSASKRVLLIVNRTSEASVEIGSYYAATRKVPRSHVLEVNIKPEESIRPALYRESIEVPARRRIAALKARIDFIVLTKGVPLKLIGGGYSLDAHLGAMDLAFAPIERLEPDQVRRAINPYFNRAEPFDSRKFGFYLVTRLDGYTVADAKRLVTHSVAASAEPGLFLFDIDTRKTKGGYQVPHESMLRAAKVLRAKGRSVRVDETEAFVGSAEPLAGYVSWGSNSTGYSRAVYRSLQFRPGALAETYVSTSARTFSRVEEGQSLIADLIAQGVTGVKGYVTEPYTVAMAQPDVLLDRYTSGFTLAESFAMASPLLKWKDVIVCDPLCAPYRRRSKL